ncbi:FAD-dependent oxidoreductase [Parvibaculum sp.]|uniref:NAD(P)/FAD-dependent oxidoreductase n=1 Tax=Parvibaculum sp. TaxID=2024848 RepID=UPI000C8F7046|nr:FAD-dependent oxidoreductase [Parvibaculum sp.]MAB14327.1 hypothetical protein [Parvibaculum sp.]
MTAGTLIIGGGLAGFECARQLRNMGYKDSVRILSSENLFPYQRPPLSKDALKATDPDVPFLSEEAELRSLEIVLHKGREATSIDKVRRVVTTSDGVEYPFDTLVIATGARPKTISAPGAGATDFYTLRDWGDARVLGDALREAENVCVVGGGVIGLEVACAAVGLGCNVRVIEQQSRIMSRSLPAQMAQLLQRLLEEKGIGFELGASILRIDRNKSVEAICLADGTCIPADLTFVGIGVSPRDELAEAAGIAVSDGVLADERGRTSDANVFAVGDAARWGAHPGKPGCRHETYNDAMAQARIVAGEIAGQDCAASILPTFWSEQAEIYIQGAGEAQGDDLVLRRSKTSGAASCLVLKEGRATGAFAIGAPSDFAAMRRLIGKPVANPSALADLEVQLRTLVQEIERAAA